jgi:serine/threonine protein phosphatase 1
MGKIFAIGDVHGCLRHLREMISLIDADPREDTLVFIGDYIDRGPDSKGVVDFILDLQASHDHVVCLLGNHERMFLNYHVFNADRDLFLSNGGQSTIDSYGTVTRARGEIADVPDRHMEFYRSLLPIWESEGHIFVHAGLRPRVPLEKQDPEDLIWIRHEFFQSTYRFEKTVVFGHTPFAEPYVMNGKIGIDTGAVYGGKLTCLEIPAMKFHFVE